MYRNMSTIGGIVILFAAIEAARAGEAGKGYAVAAEADGGKPPLSLVENTVKKLYPICMKTTFDIPQELISAVQKASKKRTKKEAITVALEEFVRIRRSEELTSLLGTFEDFMDQEELEAQRSDS